MIAELWMASVGQTLFVAFWFTRPWWRRWVGRVVMTKSIALCLVLWFWLIGFYFPDHAYRDVLRDVLLRGIAVAIWLQFLVLVYEAFLKGRASWDRSRDTDTDV